MRTGRYIWVFQLRRHHDTNKKTKEATTTYGVHTPRPSRENPKNPSNVITNGKQHGIASIAIIFHKTPSRSNTFLIIEYSKLKTISLFLPV